MNPDLAAQPTLLRWPLLAARWSGFTDCHGSGRSFVCDPRDASRARSMAMLHPTYVPRSEDGGQVTATRQLAQRRAVEAGAARIGSALGGNEVRIDDVAVDVRGLD